MGKDTMSKSCIHPPSRGNLSAWLLLPAPNPACLIQCSNPASHRKTILITVLFRGVRSLGQQEGKESESLKVGRWDSGCVPWTQGWGAYLIRARSAAVLWLLLSLFSPPGFGRFQSLSSVLPGKCSSFWVCLVLPSGSLKLCLNVE